MATTADLRIGAVIRYQGELCIVLESIHRTPGNLRAFYQVKMRVIKTGKLKEERFRSGEEIEFVDCRTQNYTFLYHDGDTYTFMRADDYEQVPVDAVALGDATKWLKDGQEVQILVDDMERVVSVQLPTHVTVRITHTEPGVRGDTATNVLKPATVETGAQVSVPLFVNEGDLVRVETATGNYIDRVKE
jgi:elongation factor P